MSKETLELLMPDASIYDTREDYHRQNHSHEWTGHEIAESWRLLLIEILNRARMEQNQLPMDPNDFSYLNGLGTS